MRFHVQRLSAGLAASESFEALASANACPGPGPPVPAPRTTPVRARGIGHVVWRRVVRAPLRPGDVACTPSGSSGLRASEATGRLEGRYFRKVYMPRHL